MNDRICPDCGHALSTHDVFKDGRCPVVPFTPVHADDVFSADELLAIAEAKPEICPVCGHTDDHHDERGCDIDGCNCEGP